MNLRLVVAIGTSITCALLSIVAAPTSQAHDFAFLDTVVVFQEDGSYRIDVTADLDALALGVSPSTDSQEVADALYAMDPATFAAAVERAQETMLRRIRIRFDDSPVQASLEFPDADSARLKEMETPSRVGVIARFTGEVPQGAAEFSFFASRSFGPVYLTILNEATGGGLQYPMEPGARSDPYRLDGSGDSPMELTGGAVWRYIKLGFTHILPLGLDHILFVLGLFLLSDRWKPLLLQISAFTVAHTATLALSIYGVVSLAPSIVEPLIALSIAYVAIENLWTRELKPWRLALVFVFGLLHGLGFAGVLVELGLPSGQALTGLLSFNVGVEFGQLAVVGLAALALGWARKREWYRNRVVIPASLLIAAAGVYWTIERTFG